MKALKLSAVLICAISLAFITGCKSDEDNSGSGTSTTSTTTSKSTKTPQLASAQSLAAIPMEKIKEEVAKLDVKKLEDKAKEYKEKIDDSQAEIEKLMEKLKQIPLPEQVGQEAQAIQGEIKELTTAIGALSQRLNVYIDAIKEKGGDIQGLIKGN